MKRKNYSLWTVIFLGMVIFFRNVKECIVPLHSLVAIHTPIVFCRVYISLGRSRVKRGSYAMVVSWDSIFVQYRLTTERIFRVKERDYISTSCSFANTISYRSCIRFTIVYFLNISFLLYRLCQSGYPTSTIITLISLSI